MNRRRLARALVVLGIFLASCSEEPPAQAPPGAPNVVLVSIDSLRYDHLGCYGYARPTSPTIDRLASEGVRFQTAVSTSSWTLPAHAALFTGLADSAHGLVDNGLALARDRVTLAETFRKNGWQTAGFFGGPYLHPTFGLGKGFERYQSCMTKIADALGDTAVRTESRSRRGASHADVTGPRTLAEITRWLDTADQRPFFLFVHLWDVHYDYIPPREFVDMFDPGYAGHLTGVDIMLNPAIGPNMDPRDFQHLVALYDGEIRFSDQILGEILDELERRGRMQNTLVVVTADHGEEFLEHGGKGHQRTLYDEVIRIPLVLNWKGHFGPKDSAPHVIDDQVRIIDIMPTLLTLAGIEHQPAVMGRDLTPLLMGRPMNEEPALSELLADGGQMRALRAARFKTVSTFPSQPARGFDLAADPREQTAIGPQDPRVTGGVEQLTSELERARTFHGGARAQATEVDPELLQRLRSLGYLGGDEHRKDE